MAFWTPPPMTPTTQNALYEWWLLELFEMGPSALDWYTFTPDEREWLGLEYA